MSRRLFLSCCVALALSACAAPRIMILRDPLTRQEHLDLGLAYEQKGDLDPAIRHYRKAAKGPLRPQAWFYMGNAYLQKGDYSQAESAYQKAIHADARHADAHNNLAWLYFLQRKNLARAEELAERAIHLNPGRQDVYADTLKKIQELRR